MQTFIPASPLPYRASHNHINAVSNGKWYRVATISGAKHTPEANMQNATFIAIACNAHADLVAALELLLNLEENGQPCGTEDLQQARAALAKATQ